MSPGAFPEREPDSPRLTVVPLPAWSVDYFYGLCELFGCREAFADYLMSLLEPEIRKGLHSPPGQLAGMPAAVGAMALDRLHRRELARLNARTRRAVRAFDPQTAQRLRRPQPAD